MKNDVMDKAMHKMQVPIKKMRFPVIDGTQTKVTLKSSRTGTFMNIGFIAGLENTINGNIADELLNRWADVFSIIKVNGKRIQEGQKETEREMIKKSIMDSLKDEYDLVPKNTGNKRDRKAHEQIANNEVPSEIEESNSFKDKVPAKKVEEKK